MRPNAPTRALLLALWLAAPAAALAADEALPEPPGEGIAADAPAEASEAPLAGDPAPEPGADPAAEAADPLLDDEAFSEDDRFFDADDPIEDSAARDPFELVNRGVFAFNRGLDTVLLDPLTRSYQFVVPEPGRRALERVFLNLDTPVIFANQVLQLRPKDAACTLARFAINTTAGAGGLFDPAAHGAGLERTEADFGLTLARWGTPSGPYLILPVFGPSTARDAFGDAVDVMSDPLTYFTGPFRWWTWLIGGSEGIVVLESNAGQLRELEAGSLDFYSALRSAYLQSRDAQVRAVRGEPQPGDGIRQGSVAGAADR